jgi:hypothetical protein
MLRETRYRRRLWRITLVISAVVLFVFVYQAIYYRTTTLRIDTPQLDWYAYRKFSTRPHYILFLPMIYSESRYDRSNPGYTLQAQIVQYEP